MKRRPARTVRELTAIVGPTGLFPVGILVAISVVERFDDAAFGVLGPEIRRAFHLSNARYLALATLTSVLPLLLSGPIGYLGDRSNRVRLSRLGGFVWGITAVATGLAPALWFLAIARVLGGVGQVVNEPVHASLLADYYPPSAMTPVYTAYRFATTGLALAGAPLAGVLAAAIDWRFAFVVLALPTFVAVVVMTRLREPARGESLAIPVPDEVFSTMGEGFRRVRAISTLRRTWVAAFILGGAAVPFGNYTNLYFDEVFHLSATVRGFASGLLGIAGLAGLAAGGALAQRTVRRGQPDGLPFAIGIIGTVFAAGITLMALAPTAPLAIVAMFVASIGSIGFLPAYQTTVALVAPPRLRTQAFAWSLVWYALGAIIVGTLIGAIGDAHGQRIALFVLALLVVAASLVEMTCRQFVDRDIAAAVTANELTLTNALLSCRGLDVAYDGVQVLFGVDVDVYEGEIVALLGTNGAGKSTLLRAMSGLVDPAGGAIVYDGRDITHADARTTARLGIVHVPGGRGVFPGLSVAENLRVASWLHRGDLSFVDGALENIRSMFPVLGERIDEAAGDLSGGEQQMLSLAQAMLARPRLLVIDELSLGLAPIVVDALVDVVRAIHAAGTTVIVVEQSVTTALQLASRAVFMEKGEVRFDGAAADLLARPELLRAVYLGRSTGAAGRRRRQTPEITAAEAKRRTALLEGTAVLETRGIVKRYGGILALDGVDLSLHHGAILGIIGPNGAGKTTLFDVISGLQPADGGEVVLAGSDVTRRSAAARSAAGLGRSFQDARLFPSLTVRETLAVACERTNDSRAMLPAAFHLPLVADAERSVSRSVADIIDFLELGAYADKFVGELSTGSRRIVDLGVMLAHSPAVVILDEPSSGIAQSETAGLAGLLRSVQRELGASLLVIEHDIGLITTIADHLVALDRGRIVAHGLPHDVLTNPLVVESYLGNTSDGNVF